MADYERRGGYTWCSAINCKNNSGMPKSDLSFFRFPKDLARSKEWVIRSRRKDLEDRSPSYLYKNCKLCSVHFEDCMFLNFLKNRLHIHAVPTKFNVPNPPPLVGSQRKPPKPRNITDVVASLGTPMEENQCPEAVPDNLGISTTSTPEASEPEKEYQRLRKLLNKKRVEIHRLKRQNEALRDQLKELKAKRSLESLCDKYLPEKMKGFVMLYDKNNRSKNKRQIKALALGLYFLSPKAYVYLSNYIPLPTPRTIRRVLTNLPVNAGISDWVLNSLSAKLTELGDLAKHCIICVDEMTLKPHLNYNITKDAVIGAVKRGEEGSVSAANAVLVVMVRGIISKWKQAIGYYFLRDACQSEALKGIIFDAVEKLTSIGMDVHCVVSDMGTNFQKLNKMLGVTPSHPHFTVNGKQIFYIYDVPHLLKSLRNNVMSHNFHFNGKIASWDDIVQLYHHDQHQSLRLASKLNESIMSPNNFMKMKVKYAAKVFSHTVAAALDTHVRLGAIPIRALGTVEFISRIDSLFDCLNSSSLKAAKQYHRPISADSTVVQFLRESAEFIESIEVVSRGGEVVTNRINCLTGWQVTISATLQLWEKLSTYRGITCLMTRRLNQDPLENFFGDIRKQGGNSDHPTPQMFQSGFKKLLLTTVGDRFDKGNCVSEVDSFATQFSELCVQGSRRTKKSPLLVKTHDYRNEILQDNAEVYVAGYLMRKCLQQHSCDTCLRYSQDNNVMVDPSQLYSFNKAFGEDSFSGLVMPHSNFVEMVSQMDKIFENALPTLIWEPGVGRKLLDKMRDVNFNLPCPYFSIGYCKKLLFE